jgi:hypothetical protein
VDVNQSMETISGDHNFKGIDPDPMAGSTYYRLKYTDLSGQVLYSNAERITNEDSLPGTGDIRLTAIEPTIFTEGFKINFTSKFESTVELIIVNNSGKTVYANKMEAKKGQNTFEFKEGQKLFRNIYFVKLICNGQQVTKKVLKK